MKKTICALSTPPGIGGISVIRISGDKAFEVTEKCFKGKSKISESDSHKILYGKFFGSGKLIDTVTISIFRSPNSYTGENVIEIGCHGGSVVAGEILSALIEEGAVHAEPGEFTRRAFLNGKLDLAQVEAVADLIHSVSIPGSQTAARQLDGKFTERLNEMRDKLIETAGLLELELDFSEEDIEFSNREVIKSHLFEIIGFCRELADSFRSAEILRSGFFIGIAGYPNSGKSTFFNALLKRDRAIVSNIPGTTRDYLEESIMINGIPIRIIDTAGFRESGDTIEIEGIKFAKSVLKQANLVVVLNDISVSKDNSIHLYNKLRAELDTDVLYVQNKIDLLENESAESDDSIMISAKHGSGIEEIKKIIGKKAAGSIEKDKDVLINQRQSLLLNRASKYLESAVKAIEEKKENELISIEIKDAAYALGEITGRNWNESVLNAIFDRFCIGK